MSHVTAIVVMGVSGVGKTHIGTEVARALGWDFQDADAYHSDANVEKMRSGQPLTDADRWPWLDSLNGMLRERSHVVLACSALKAGYRRRLLEGLAGEALVVYLHASPQTLTARLQGRQGHYMPAALLDSQFAALEMPGSDEALWVDAEQPVSDAVQLIVSAVAPA